MGFGFGGVINRFSNLDDVGGLFLVGTAGLRRPVTDSIGAFLQFDATTFAMGRDELHYTKTVLFTDVTAGFSFYVDTVPGGVRELHEAELAEHQRSGH